MAKPSWIKTNPSSGSGNATVAVSSTTEHTGRVARTGVLTFKAANVANVERTVNQAGKPEYVDIDDAASADKAGKASVFGAAQINNEDHVLLHFLYLRIHKD